MVLFIISWIQTQSTIYYDKLIPCTQYSTHSLYHIIFTYHTFTYGAVHIYIMIYFQALAKEIANHHITQTICLHGNQILLLDACNAIRSEKKSMSLWNEQAVTGTTLLQWVFHNLGHISCCKMDVQAQYRMELMTSVHELIDGIIYLVQVRLMTGVLLTPSSTWLRCALMTPKSWQYISCYWDASFSHLVISDLSVSACWCAVFCFNSICFWQMVQLPRTTCKV